ncbi:PEP-CTERM sorting domain-containing protein [[Empedobacter] haloabium]|uniref:PEP-CTERM sorting domain-containing protein n=1 Tax=[Empedobacter] haloabium TaxID=592317 RepID=A0ABZ1UQG9_9BURK
MPFVPSLSRTVIAAAVLALAANANAASFTIAGTSNTAQTLGPGAGQTGTIAAGGQLTVGGSTVAVTISGGNAVLGNLGTIDQTGSGRAVRDNKGTTGLVINNGATGLMRTADADVIQVGGNGSVTLHNHGSLLSLNATAGGAQAVDFSSMTGANMINNYFGAVMTAHEADAVRPGANGLLSNAGTIQSLTSAGASSDGIDGQANSGIRIVNAGSGLVSGGRHGITAEQADAGSAFTLHVTNDAGGTIRGTGGSGINVDGFNGRQVVTIVNAGAIFGNGVTGDGDGVDVDGLVDITNAGTIRSLNAFSAPGAGLAFSEGISAGGGRIVNTGMIEGLVNAGNGNAVGRGITLAGNDIASGPLAGTREGLYGNAMIVNQGLIRGQGGSAIVAVGAASGHTVTIDNRAGGRIVGGGLGSAAIQGGADGTYITNAGTIDGGAGGRAIALGGAVNMVTISGGSAVVVGDIDGGGNAGSALVIDAGAGNAFAYGGAVSGFGSVVLRSGVMTLVGANRIDASSALVLAGGTLDLSGAPEQTFARLSLTDSSTILLGSSALTFNGLSEVGEGAALAVIGSGGTFRFLGDYAGNAMFADLMRVTTVDHMAVTYSFDGLYTNVQAVPEPSALALLLGGFGVLGLFARRRARVV